MNDFAYPSISSNAKKNLLPSLVTQAPWRTSFAHFGGGAFFLPWAPMARHSTNNEATRNFIVKVYLYEYVIRQEKLGNELSIVPSTNTNAAFCNPVTAALGWSESKACRLKAPSELVLRQLTRTNSEYLWRQTHLSARSRSLLLLDLLSKTQGRTGGGAQKLLASCHQMPYLRLKLITLVVL